MNRWIRQVAPCLILLLLVVALPVAHADRIKDISQVAGVRQNQLIGYGLVVGLDGSGDQTSQAPFTTQSLENMLQRFGVTMPANVRPQLNNVAAVMVTAELPAFAKPGQSIDVVVSSVGNAKSLRGGTLLMTPLHGADGRTYAVAQGNVIIGGVSAHGKSGSSVVVNINNTGRIPDGASVERAVPNTFANGGPVVLNLNTPNFTTASRMVKAIDQAFGPHAAQAIDATSIAVNAPAQPSQRVVFLGQLQNVQVDPGSAPAQVIINARTGTIVIGANVRVSPAAVASGGIVVSIGEQPGISQPAPFSKGQTALVPRSSVSITEKGGHLFKLGPDVNLDQIVRAMNRIGATPNDLISILQALKAAGALHAKLVVI